MASRKLEATLRAVRAYRKGMSIYALAKKHGINASTLYRALRAVGVKT